MSEPFYWAERDGWYIFVRSPNGKRRRLRLAKTKREAFNVWKTSLQTVAASADNPLFSRVAARWLELQLRRSKRGDVSAKWLKRVTRTVESFNKAHPGVRCASLTPSLVREWLGDVSASYEHTEASTLKQILRWAVEEDGSLAKNPLANMRLSTGGRREVVLMLQQHVRLARAATVPSLKAMLWVAWWTGARPSELRELTWEQIAPDLATASLSKHKTARKTGKPRTIYLNANCRQLLRPHRKKKGHVFTNTQGSPWTKDTLVGWMRKLRLRTGLDGTAYAYRHSYATRALEAGVPVADLAEMLGTSIEVISRNYGHLDKRQDRLKALADRL